MFEPGTKHTYTCSDGPSEKDGRMVEIVAPYGANASGGYAYNAYIIRFLDGAQRVAYEAELSS